ncbi:MAG: alpha/beta hydrolase [Elusimicrobiota bacterium]
MLKAFFLIVILISVLWFFLRVLEQNAIFYPYKKIELTPRDLGMNYEDVYIKTDDNVKLNGWFIPVKDKAKRKTAITILYLHGNAGNISHRVEIAKVFNEYDYNFFIVDYRGFGKSNGIPSEKGTYRDALAAYNYLITREDINPEKIVLYGQSLGGAIAIDLATKVKIAAIITEASLSSTIAVAKNVYPFLPLGLMMTQKFDALSKVDKITAPKLFIHSMDDEIVSFSQGEELFKKAKEPKEFMLARGGHNSSFFIYTDEYIKRIKIFLKNHLR